MLMLNIGKMSHRITLFSLSRGTDDGFGGDASWVKVRDTWAEFLKARVTPSAYASDGAAVLVTQGMRIRAQDIEKGWRVSEKDHVYDVLDVDRSDPEVYVLTTKEARL